MSLRSGAPKGHQNCLKAYICTNSSHDSSSDACDVLVCDKHKDTPENAKLLEKFKEEFIKKYQNDLPSASKNVKIVMHNQAN